MENTDFPRNEDSSKPAETYYNWTDSESEDEHIAAEETVSPKEVAMRKISFALADLEDQMRKGTKKLILRTSFDESHFQLKYTSNLKLKLERDLNCLHQVYDLLENDKKSTKRELYYEFKGLYEVQRNMDTSIQAICQLLDEKRSNLNILSCSRGLLRGSITFVTETCGIVDGRVQTVLINDSLLTSNLICEAKFVLIVEKDTTFQKLLDERFQEIFPDGILVTAKGYPDISTRNVVKFICETRRLPVYGLFDADPHGIEIYLTYKYGGVKDSAEGRDAFVPTVKWIGLYPSDFHRFPIVSSQRLPLTNSDHKKLQKMIPRSIQLGESVATRELDWMLQNRFKLELESINLCGSEFMARHLIMPRITGEEKEDERVDDLWRAEEKETNNGPMDSDDSDFENLMEIMVELMEEEDSD